MQLTTDRSHAAAARRAHRIRCVLCGLALLLWFTDALAFAPAAAAYCRADLETMANGQCMEKDGVPRLHWTRSCSTYTFSEHAFERIPLLDEEQVRAAVADSFAAWSEVDCGRQPFFVQEARALSEQEEADFEWDVPNTSLVAVLSASEWAEGDYGSDVVALTTLFHDPDTGEIFDVDIELNAGAGSFSNCSGRCVGDGLDLRNTVTHEAGHYLGLGHSREGDATMAPYAVDGREIEKATLEDDDRAGYCALELPAHACAARGCSCPPPPIYSSGTGDEGCSTTRPRAAPNAAWGLPAGLLALIACRRRARRAL